MIQHNHEKRYIIVGNKKHYPSAIKEWPNSIYSYNKASLKNINVKNKITSKLLKSYFNLSLDTKLARSKRMRSLIKRSSSKLVHVSRAEIKHTNDKATVNIYMYNREKEYLLRKIYSFNKNLYTKMLWESYKNMGTDLMNNKNYTYAIKKNNNAYIKKHKSKNILTRKVTKYNNLYMFNEINQFLFRYNRKLNIMSSLVLKYLTLSLLHFFNVSTHNKEEKDFSHRYLALFRYLKATSNNVSYNTNKLLLLFNFLFARYYTHIRQNMLKKRTLTNNFFVKYLINQSKLSNFLPKAKLILDNILGKKVELNIINLKYIHLNSDIFMNFIAMKSKKKRSVSRILKKSLALTKSPNMVHELRPGYSINKLQGLNLYKKLDVNILYNMYRKHNNFPYNTVNKDISKDMLQSFIYKLYPSYKLNTINGTQSSYSYKEILGKNMQIISNLKYKWLSGIRLEAAGRLTRRYTASRSLYTFKYRGNLKNMDTYGRLFSVGNPSAVMLRNDAKANCQYTFVKSKKRIGAFGLKGWISSN